MLKSRELLSNALSQIASNLNKEKKAKGFEASGKSEKSIRIEVVEKDGNLVGSIYGADYIESMIYGRGPTKRKQGGILQREIRKWLDHKSFAAKLNAKGKESLSWAISKAIHKRGTLAFQGKRQAIDLRKIVNDTTKDLGSNIKEGVIIDTRSQILRGWKNGTNTNT